MVDPRSRIESNFEWNLIYSNPNDEFCNQDENDGDRTDYTRYIFQFKNLNDNPKRVDLYREYCGLANSFDDDMLNVLNNINASFDDLVFNVILQSEYCLPEDGDRTGCDKL